jgi:hypothetical protein
VSKGYIFFDFETRQDDQFENMTVQNLHKV